jgi:putative oxidoreductase
MTTVTHFRQIPSPRSQSIIATLVEKLVVLCALLPYALVALVLRLVMARVIFVAGQSKIAGPTIPIDLPVPGLDFSIVLPTEIKAETFRLFETQYASLPLPPSIAAYLFTYAEFVLPVCLVLGFATRFASLALFAMTALISFYVTPDLLWTTHIYWLSILLVLISLGPGALSLDALIRYVSGK